MIRQTRASSMAGRRKRRRGPPRRRPPDDDRRRRRAGRAFESAQAPTIARVRAHAEVLRPTPRHGTRRRLSALSIGILALSLGRFVNLARDELHRLLAAFQRGVPAVAIPR